MNKKQLDTQCDVMKNNLIVFGVDEACCNYNQEPNTPKIPPKNTALTLRKINFKTTMK